MMQILFSVGLIISRFVHSLKRTNDWPVCFGRNKHAFSQLGFISVFFLGINVPKS